MSGLLVNMRNPKFNYAEDYKEEIIKLYTIDKLSAAKIGKIFNISQPTISRNLKEWGIISRKNGEDQKKYSLNEHYFDEINIPEKAYILGFIYSDGCVSDKGFQIALQEKDKEILEKIKIELNSNSPLVYVKEKFYNKKTKSGYLCQPQYMLRINSTYLRDKLIDHGAFKRKTDKIEFPYWMNENLIPHFIRGMIDGDGCISRQGRKENKSGIIITLVSNKKFIEQLSEYLHNKGWNNSIRKSSKTSNVAYTLYMYKKSHIKEFLDWIYKDSTIHLQRKYDRYYSYFYEEKPIIPYKE